MKVLQQTGKEYFEEAKALSSYAWNFYFYCTKAQQVFSPL